MQSAKIRATTMASRALHICPLAFSINLVSVSRAVTTSAAPSRPAFHRPSPAFQRIRSLHVTTVRLRDSQAYSYDQIKQFSEAPSDERILIDVREPSEYEAGYIPSALNIPISSQPDALLLDPVDFETRFGFPKPDEDKEVVFYCKAGVRSKAAAKMAESGGYRKVGEYPGSWLDWIKNGGSSEKP